MYEISHKNSKDIIRTQNYDYFAFLGQKFGFWTKKVSSIKTIFLLQKQQ